MTEEHHVPPTKTLWMLMCDIGYAVELHPFYAVSEQEAEQKAQTWIEQQGPRILSRISLKPSPHGFRILRTELPGFLE